jgi:hypothetical protein
LARVISRVRRPPLRGRRTTRSSPVAEMLLLDRVPAAGRLAIGVLVLGIAAAWGFAALALHQHELDTQAAGHALNPLGTLFATGSSPATAWPGWVVAVILEMSAIRLRYSAVEPPAGRGNARSLSAAELRSGLRREYAVARWSLVGVSVLTLADVGRLAVSGTAALLGVHGAGDGLGWMGVEAGGLVAATAALCGWVLSFRGQLDRSGALDHPRSGAGIGP